MKRFKNHVLIMCLAMGALGMKQNVSATPLDDLKDTFTKLSGKLGVFATALNILKDGTAEAKPMARDEGDASTDKLEQVWNKVKAENLDLVSNSLEEQRYEILKKKSLKNISEAVLKKLLLRFAAASRDGEYKGLSISDNLTSQRLDFTLTQLNDIAGKIPNKEDRVVHTSFGAGGLLQVYWLAMGLSWLGFKKIEINAIDSEGYIEDGKTYAGKSRLDAFKKLTEGNEITIKTYFNVYEYIKAVNMNVAAKSNSFDEFLVSYHLNGLNDSCGASDFGTKIKIWGLDTAFNTLCFGYEGVNKACIGFYEDNNDERIHVLVNKKLTSDVVRKLIGTTDLPDTLKMDTHDVKVKYGKSLADDPLIKLASKIFEDRDKFFKAIEQVLNDISTSLNIPSSRNLKITPLNYAFIDLYNLISKTSGTEIPSIFCVGTGELKGYDSLEHWFDDQRRYYAGFYHVL